MFRKLLWLLFGWLFVQSLGCIATAGISTTVTLHKDGTFEIDGPRVSLKVQELDEAD